MTLIYPPRNTRKHTRYNYRAALLAHYQQRYERLCTAPGHTHDQECKAKSTKEKKQP